MEAKYNMTREQNVFLAKRNIVDYIWKSAKLEGLGVTYPDTEAIYQGMSVSGVSVNDIIAVNNLKRAWRFVLENLDSDLNYQFVCQINRIVGTDGLIYDAGFVRNIPVSIGGTSWKPDIPIESIIKEELSELTYIESPTDRAISTMLYLARKQIFLDGNKRTAMLAANQIMIQNGCGIISVPIEKQSEFVALLIAFYESGSTAEIKEFIYRECVDGLDFSRKVENAEPQIIPAPQKPFKGTRR